MAQDLSGVDVFFLMKELKSLEGAKVDKIVQLDRKLFTIRFFTGKKKQMLRVLVPELINLTEQKYDSPQKPLGFCSFLRKYLQNTKLVHVSQKSFERIILFEFDSLKFGRLSLIIELFKPGNLILCKEEDSKLIILNALERQEFKSRKIGAREEYVFPPEKTNPVAISTEALKEKLTETDKTLGKALATELSLGGVFAEEIVTRAKLDKDSKNISLKDAEKLKSTMTSFFSQTPQCEGRNGKIYPVHMESLESSKNGEKEKSKPEQFESFNLGLDSITISTALEEGKTSEQKKKKSKTANLLDIQEKRIKELEKEIDENQKVGEFIYEHYTEFQKLLDSVKELREKGHSFTEIEDLLKKNKKFKKMDKAKKTISMTFDK